MSADADPSARKLRSGQGLPALRPAAYPDRADDAEGERQQHPAMHRIGSRNRKDEAAIADKDARQQLPGLARRRRAHPQHRPPEEQLQQQRDVTEGFDVDLRELADEPVARQPRDPHHGAENGRQHDPERRDIERVEQPDEKGAGIGIGRGIGDQRLADAEGGFAVEKAEAAGDVLAAQIDERVVDEKGDERDDDGDEQDLIDDTADAGVVPRRRPGGAAERRSPCRSPSPCPHPRPLPSLSGSASHTSGRRASTDH